MAFTKGIWERVYLGENKSGRELWAITAAGCLKPRTIANLSNDPMIDAKANARLLAAAPDLLAALCALTNWAREHTSPQDSNSPHELLIAAQAAIEKALAAKERKERLAA